MAIMFDGFVVEWFLHEQKMPLRAIGLFRSIRYWKEDDILARPLSFLFRLTETRCENQKDNGRARMFGNTLS